MLGLSQQFTGPPWQNCAAVVERKQDMRGTKGAWLKQKIRTLDEREHDNENTDGEQAKDTFPAYGLQGGDVVTLDEFLFNHHLEGYNNLSRPTAN